MGNVYGTFFDCHVVRACEVKYTTEGVAIGNFSIAVNDSVKKNGEWIEDSSFFECVAYSKKAETLKAYVTSGQRMFFYMRPKQERWVDKEGKKRSRVVFIVDDFSFGEKPRGAQQGQNVPQEYQQQNYNPAPQQYQQQSYESAPQSQSQQNYGAEQIFDEGENFIF